MLRMAAGESTGPVLCGLVNVVSKFDAYPMLHIDEQLDWIGVAPFYATLDLTKGYWQIPLTLIWHWIHMAFYTNL